MLFREKKVILLYLVFFLFVVLAFWFYFFKAKAKDISTIKFKKLEFLSPTITPHKYFDSKSEKGLDQRSDADSGINYDSFDSKSFIVSRTEGYVYFSQCDPQWGKIPTYIQDKRDDNETCNFCTRACGPTSLAMGLSNSKYNTSKQIYTPVDIAKVFQQKKIYFGCSGSYIYTFGKIVSEFGYKSAGPFVLDGRSRGLKLLKNFKSAGWEAIVLFQHRRKGRDFWIGHYAYITEVGDDSLFALDPWFGGNVRKPIDILRIPKHDVKLKAAFFFRK